MEANQPRQFYRGGAAIAAFRGTATLDPFRPEDWVASTTPRFGMQADGLSRLPAGDYLRDAVKADPGGWLGPEHAAYFGESPALLVKLLDAGERLPVHAHPPRAFAFQHLSSRHGKTEAWVVLGTKGAEPVVYLGWSRDVEPGELAGWVARQDKTAMLSNLHRLPVSAGDAVLVPAGTPHAIGEGVFSVELQEPTDFSVMLELEGFDLDPGAGDLGLGREVALACVARHGFGRPELDRLVQRSAGGTAVVEAVLPPAAAPYFRAQRARAQGTEASFDASFAVLVVTTGAGSLAGEDWHVPMKAGQTWVVPWGAGPSKLSGDLELLRCLPPLPTDAAQDDPRPAR
jgi:mannose-6-phosphate isomerase